MRIQDPKSRTMTLRWSLSVLLLLKELTSILLHLNFCRVASRTSLIVQSILILQRARYLGR